jgi:hypothetical protein
MELSLATQALATLAMGKINEAKAIRRNIVSLRAVEIGSH